MARIICLRTKSVVTWCTLIAIVAIPGIQSRIRRKQQPSLQWASMAKYNGQTNTRRSMGIIHKMERPSLPFYNRYPYVSSGVISNNAQWKSLVSNYQSQGNKRLTTSGDKWLNPGTWIKMNNAPNTTNVRYVPIVAFLPTLSQTKKTQQTHSVQDSFLPKTATMTTINKQSWITMNDDYISTTTIESQATQAERRKEKEGNSSEESTTEMTETNRNLLLSDGVIDRLIEQALRNGELLDQDEWFKRYVATKRKQYGKSQKLPDGNNADRGSPNPQDDLRALTPSVCSNSTFCERVADYPEQLISQAIENNDNLRFLQQNSSYIEPDVEERLDFGKADDWPLCRSYVRTIYPRSAKTANQNWLYVINQNNFKQGIRVEVCVNEGNTCDDLEDYVPEGYKVSCKQNYLLRELLAVNSDGMIEKNNFKLPSNCCCHREFVDSD